jgi:signal transduction histidine kinase/serine/threonine protein kinase
MFGLPGYQITEIIYAGTDKIICRGLDDRKQPVIIKTFGTKNPCVSAINSLRREKDLLETLDRLKILKFYDRAFPSTAVGNRNSETELPILILENFGDRSLEQLIRLQTISLEKFLLLAIALTDSLRELHQRQIIHHNIHPAIIAIDSNRDRLQLLDYSFASLSTDTPPDRNALQTTFAYLSPEQLVREDRAIDYRSDLYSLGVIFYQMLTGTLPFFCSESDKLINFHLFQIPSAPNKLKPEIPEVISAIVMKLLAKTAENRYQSAAGLKLDLERCWLQFNQVGAIDFFALEIDSSTQQLIVSLPRLVLTNENLQQRVRVCNLEIQAALTQKLPQKTIEMGLKALTAIGISLKQESPSSLDFDRLINLPEINEPELIAILQLFNKIYSAASLVDSDLVPQVTFSAIDFCFNRGNCLEAAIAYANHACYLYGSNQNFDLGERFARLSLQIVTELNDPIAKSILSNLLKSRIGHWREHLKATIDPLEKALQIEDNREELFFERTVFVYCSNLFFLGESLVDLTDKYSSCLENLQQLARQECFVYVQISQQLILNLRNCQGDCEALAAAACPPLRGVSCRATAGKCAAPAGDRSSTNEQNFQKITALVLEKESERPLVIFYAYLINFILDYLFKESSVLMNTEKCQQFKKHISGSILVAIYNFYYSLSLLAQYKFLDFDRQQNCLKIIEKNQTDLKKWTGNCPSNFQHKYDLIEAEKARALQNNWQAVELYDRAIQKAKEQGYVQEEALANELAAEFYLEYNKEKIAKTYLIDACQNYLKWGAIAKAKQLKEKYAQLLASVAIDASDVVQQSTHQPDKKEDLNILDLASVIKGYQTISQEIILENLLEKLIQLLLKISGAQKGFLILKRKEKFIIEIAAAIVKEKIVITRQAIPANLSQQIAMSVINDVITTGQAILFCSNKNSFVSSKKELKKSIICCPIIQEKQTLAIIYLENKQKNFQNESLELVKLISKQAGILIKNSLLYQNLEQSTITKKIIQQFRRAIQKEKEVNEVKTHFICMTSHEFRTPLTTILSSTELLEHYGHNWEQDKKQIHFDKIQKAVARITNLLDDILLINQVELDKLKFQPVCLDLVKFFQNVVDENSVKLDRNKYQLIFSTKAASLLVCIDEKLIRYMLNSLLSNAIKYSPKGGAIELSLITKNEHILFIVKDRGIGIPQEDYKNLFNIFYRAQNVGTIPGVGLGLSLVKKCVELHNGKINFISKLGEGSEFIVEIPADSNNTDRQVNWERTIPCL